MEKIVACVIIDAPVNQERQRVDVSLEYSFPCSQQSWTLGNRYGNSLQNDLEYILKYIV